MPFDKTSLMELKNLKRHSQFAPYMFCLIMGLQTRI